MDNFEILQPPYLLFEFLNARKQKSIKEFYYFWEFRDFPYRDSRNLSKEIGPRVTRLSLSKF